MNILNKFTARDLVALQKMNSYFDFNSASYEGQENINRRIQNVILIIKRKFECIGICVDTIIDEAISEGLDLDQLESYSDKGLYIGETICILSNIIFYKCLLKLNYITDKIKDLFYAGGENRIFISYIFRYYPFTIFKDIENGYRGFELEFCTKLYQMYNLNKFGISNKRAHEYLMGSRKTVCEYKHLINIFKKTDYEFSDYRHINYSYNPFDFMVWAVIHDHELERFIEREYNGKIYKIHIHTILEKLMKNCDGNDHFLPDIIKSYKDLQRLKFEDLIKVDSLKNSYEEIVIENILLQIKYEVDFPEDKSFIDTDVARVIKNSQELINEGEKMRHCVGGRNYIDKCAEGKIKIVHFNTNIEDGVTAEFVKNKDGIFYIQQIKGLKNRQATVEETVIVNSYLNMVNQI